MFEKKEATQYFPALTGLRTVAASMVFLLHFNPFPPHIFGDYLHVFVAEFHVGVTIFFVLSGFLICHRYYHLVSLKKTWLLQYFINRFARIYPMYFIITCIYFLPFICNCIFRDQFKIFLLNITFMRGFFDEYKFTGIATGWSLTVEEMFYFLFPLIILFSKKIKLLIQPIIIIAIGILLWLIFRRINFHGFISSLQFLFEFTFFGRCFEFFTGIYLALIIKSTSLSQIKNRTTYKTSIGIIYIFICIILLALNSEYNRNSGSFLLYETIINNFILPPGIAILFYGLITEASITKRTLESKAFVLLGKSSYIFYLIHNGPLFNIFYTKWHIKIYNIYILMQLISILLYLSMEMPLNNLIRRFSREKFFSRNALI